MEPLERMRRLERHILGLLTALDVDIIGRETAKTIALIKLHIGDARLDIRDFEMADSRAELVTMGEEALRRVEILHRSILRASESGIFSAIDVIEMTTGLEQISRDIRAAINPAT